MYGFYDALSVACVTLCPPVSYPDYPTRQCVPCPSPCQ